MDPVLLRLLAVAAVVVGAVVAGRLWQQRSARVRTGAGRFVAAELRSVGLDPRADHVQALLLGSPTCGPCRSVKQVLAEVEQQRPGFQWVEVDAGDHLDLARTHHVLRVPTLFLFDGGGAIVARTSGVPAVRDLTRLVDDPSLAGT